MYDSMIFDWMLPLFSQIVVCCGKSDLLISAAGLVMARWIIRQFRIQCGNWKYKSEINFLISWGVPYLFRVRAAAETSVKFQFLL